MLVRSLSILAAITVFVLMPLACGSFGADGASGAGDAEGGAGEARAPGGGEGGAVIDGPSSEGSSPPVPVELSTGHSVLRAITATETDVFFIDQAGGGGVFAVPITGGTSRPLATGGAPSSIAVDGNYVYWTDFAARTIRRSPIAGGAIISTTTEPGQGPPPSIVVAATGAVVALVGSAASTGVVRQYASDLVVTKAFDNLTNPFSLTAIGTSIYWTEGGTGYVASGTVGDTGRTLLFQENDAESIAADAAGVYWTVPSKGLIRGSLGGAGPITLAANEDLPNSIAADGTYVYWTTSKNELRRAGHQDNGTSSLFAGGFMAITEFHARAIALTSMYVVWLTADGKVLRASRQ